MRRFTARGLAVAALSAAALGAAAAADKPAEAPWYSRMLGKSEPKPADPPTFGSAPAPARPPAVVGPLDPVAQADALRAEQDAWQRRMEVCLKLRQVAAARNDDALAARADELERQATALYQQRVARIGVKSPGRSEPDAGAEPRRSPEPPVRQFREVKP